MSGEYKSDKEREAVVRLIAARVAAWEKSGELPEKFADRLLGELESAGCALTFKKKLVHMVE
jgi:hypothetical protein